MPKQSSGDDLDNTDELPILLETVAHADPDPRLLLPVNDADDDATALHAAPRLSSTGTHAVAEQATRQPGPPSGGRLDGDAVRLRELERALAEKERVVEELERTIMERRRAEHGSEGPERNTAERDALANELTIRLDSLSTELETRAARISELEAALAEAHQAAAAVDPVPTPPAPAPQALEEALEANATLAAYIDGRRQWWDRAEAERGALAERVTALERDLGASASRAEQAEALAERETARAADLRAELVETARRLDAAERTQRELRASDPERDSQLRSASTEASARQADSVSAPATPSAPSPTPDAAADTPPISEAAIEVIAQLEAEVEHKRQQVAAQMLELRDREQRLTAGAADLERTRGEISNLRGELDKAREHIVRLEHTIIDKDRALDARDTRITTLQEELKQRLGARKRDAIDLSLQGLELRMTERAREHGVDGAQGPALVCLTGDAEKRFALTKKSIVVGRGAHCDLQILTHFVSREHARISLSGEDVLIEDLGSRNGVFVNSVRIDRQMLEHGDLVTIGETQFRFVESTAH